MEETLQPCAVIWRWALSDSGHRYASKPVKTAKNWFFGKTRENYGLTKSSGVRLIENYCGRNRCRESTSNFVWSQKVSWVCQTEKMCRKALKTLNGWGQVPWWPLYSMLLNHDKARMERIWLFDSFKSRPLKGGFRNVNKRFDPSRRILRQRVCRFLSAKFSMLLCCRVRYI